MFSQRFDVSRDRIIDVLQRVINRFAITEASGQAGNLSDPVAIFILIQQYMSHNLTFFAPNLRLLF